MTIIEFDATEMVKLISICNAAIASEKKALTYLPDDSAAAQHCETEIADLEALKAKIKNAIVNG